MDTVNHSEIERWINKSKDSLEDAYTLIDYGKPIGPIPLLYYSAFYCAKALLLLDNKRYKKHSAVISDFGKIIIKKRRFPKKYGRFLNHMLDLRQKAQYSDSFNGLCIKELRSLFKRAKSFINRTQEFISNKY